MSTTAIARNFLNQVALKCREIANVDLFNSNPPLGSHKLVLDYEIPISGPSLKLDTPFMMRLGAKIQYSQNDVIKATAISVSTNFYPKHWLAGPIAWEGTADYIASSLISSMRVHLRQHFPNCTFKTIQEGDTSDLDSQLGRIYIR